MSLISIGKQVCIIANAVSQAPLYRDFWKRNDIPTVEDPFKKPKSHASDSGSDPEKCSTSYAKQFRDIPLKKNVRIHENPLWDTSVFPPRKRKLFSSSPGDARTDSADSNCSDAGARASSSPIIQEARKLVDGKWMEIASGKKAKTDLKHAGSATPESNFPEHNCAVYLVLHEKLFLNVPVFKQWLFSKIDRRIEKYLKDKGGGEAGESALGDDEPTDLENVISGLMEKAGSSLKKAATVTPTGDADVGDRRSLYPKLLDIYDAVPRTMRFQYVLKATDKAEEGGEDKITDPITGMEEPVVLDKYQQRNKDIANLYVEQAFRSVETSSTRVTKSVSRGDRLLLDIIWRKQYVVSGKARKRIRNDEELVSLVNSANASNMERVRETLWAADNAEMHDDGGGKSDSNSSASSLIPSNDIFKFEKIHVQLDAADEYVRDEEHDGAQAIIPTSAPASDQYSKKILQRHHSKHVDSLTPVGDNVEEAAVRERVLDVSRGGGKVLLQTPETPVDSEGNVHFDEVDCCSNPPLNSFIVGPVRGAAQITALELRYEPQQICTFIQTESASTELLSAVRDTWADKNTFLISSITNPSNIPFGFSNRPLVIPRPSDDRGFLAIWYGIKKRYAWVENYCDFFMLLDANSYVNHNRVKERLQCFDPKKPWLLGLGNHYLNVDFFFPHFQTGIIISRTLLQTTPWENCLRHFMIMPDKADMDRVQKLAMCVVEFGPGSPWAAGQSPKFLDFVFGDVGSGEEEESDKDDDGGVHSDFDLKKVAAQATAAGADHEDPDVDDSNSSSQEPIKDPNGEQLDDGTTTTIQQPFIRGRPYNATIMTNYADEKLNFIATEDNKFTMTKFASTNEIMRKCLFVIGTLSEPEDFYFVRDKLKWAEWHSGVNCMGETDAGTFFFQHPSGPKKPYYQKDVQMSLWYCRVRGMIIVFTFHCP